MKKLFLILMLMFASFTNATIDDSPGLTIDEEVAVGLMSGGTILAVGSLASMSLFEIPEVSVPLVAGVFVIGATLTLTGAVMGFVSESIQGEINDYNQDIGTPE